MKFISKILIGAVILALTGISFTANATVLPLAGNTYNLAGSGINTTATSFTLQSFTIKQTGHPIVDGEMSDTFFVTIDPGNSTRQEIVSCTTVTQNANGTALISGCVRGLAPLYPFTGSSAYQFSHAGGAPVIFSNAPQFYNQYSAKENNEVITGFWTAPDPVDNTGIANKEYVLSVVNGGAVSTNAVIVTGTAGETMYAGQVIYLNTSDSRWYKASSNATTTVTDSLLGIAQGAGSAGVAITSGVLIHGVDSHQIGLTAGKNYFVSAATAGATTTATTTRAIGKAVTTTSLQFDPYFVNAYAASNNTWTGTNSFNATNTLATTTLTRSLTVNNPTLVTDSSGNGLLWTFIASSTCNALPVSCTISNIPARSILKVQFFVFARGTTEGATMTFNGDTGNNYSYFHSTSTANTTSASGVAGIEIGRTPSIFGRTGLKVFNLDIYNFSTSTKAITGTASLLGGVASSSTPIPQMFSGAWSTTTAQQINSIKFQSTASGSEDYQSGVIYVYGSNF